MFALGGALWHRYCEQIKRQFIFDRAEAERRPASGKARYFFRSLGGIRTGYRVTWGASWRADVEVSSNRNVGSRSAAAKAAASMVWGADDVLTGYGA